MGNNLLTVLFVLFNTHLTYQNSNNNSNSSLLECSCHLSVDRVVSMLRP